MSTPRVTEPGLAGVTLRALGWQSASTIVVQAVQAVVTLTVAGHVAPAEFALWGIASILINAQYLLGSLGLAPALVYYQKQRWFRDGVDGAFVVSAALGLLGALTLFTAAPLFAAVFSAGFARAEVLAVVRAMSIVFLFLTVSGVPQALIEKTLDFRRKALPEVASVALYCVVAMSLMLAGMGVWSLMIGKAAQSFALVAMYWAAAPVRPRWLPRFRRRVVERLFRYGKFLTAASLIGFAVGNLDTVAVGRFAGAAALGAYALAFTVANLAPTFLSLTLGKVFFPLYAAVREDETRLRSAFARAMHSLAVVMLPTTIALWTVAPRALVEIFGDKWDPAMGLTRVLALYGLARATASATTTLLAAVGRPDCMLVAGGLSFAVPLALLAPASWLGAAGIAWAFVAGQTAATAYGLAKTRRYWPLGSLAGLVHPALAALAALAVALVLSWVVPGDVPGALLLIAFGACYMAVLLAIDRDARTLVRTVVVARVVALTTNRENGR